MTFRCISFGPTVNLRWEEYFFGQSLPILSQFLRMPIDCFDVSVNVASRGATKGCSSISVPNCRSTVSHWNNDDTMLLLQLKWTRANSSLPAPIQPTRPTDWCAILPRGCHIDTWKLVMNSAKLKIVVLVTVTSLLLCSSVLQRRTFLPRASSVWICFCSNYVHILKEPNSTSKGGQTKINYANINYGVALPSTAVTCRHRTFSWDLTVFLIAS